MTLYAGLDLAARRTNTLLNIGGRACDLGPGVAGGIGDAKAGSMRLMLYHAADRFGHVRNVLPKSGR